MKNSKKIWRAAKLICEAGIILYAFLKLFKKPEIDIYAGSEQDDEQLEAALRGE